MPFLTYEDGRGRHEIAFGDRSEVVIGRQSDCDLQLEGSGVSRKHCRCFRKDGVWMIESLSTTGGSFLNRTRVSAPTPLRNGDQIQIGQHVLSFGIAAPVANALEADEKILQQSAVADGALMKAILEVQSLGLLEYTAGGESHGTEPDASRHLLALVRILGELRVCASVEEICGTALRMAVNATAATRGVLALVEGDGFRRTAEYGRDGGAEGEMRISRTVVDKVVREKVALVVEDAGQELSAAKSVSAAHIRSILAAPMWDGSEIIGYLYLDSTDRGRLFGASDLNLVSAIGYQAAADVTRLRLQTKILEGDARRRNLSRFLSADVIRHIEEEAQKGHGALDPALSAKEQEVTILFSDVKGFTAMSERMKAAEMKSLLDDYFHRMTEILVDHHGGTLDKYIGDGIMALFGAPFSKGVGEDARAAVAAAVEMRDTLEKLRATERAFADIHIRIGVNTGRVIAGMLGSERRLEYSVIGDAVNVASRLESSGEAGRIQIGDATWQHVKDAFVCESAGSRALKNRAEPVQAWWVTGHRAKAP